MLCDESVRLSSHATDHVQPLETDAAAYFRTIIASLQGSKEASILLDSLSGTTLVPVLGSLSLSTLQCNHETLITMTGDHLRFFTGILQHSPNDTKLQMKDCYQPFNKKTCSDLKCNFILGKTIQSSRCIYYSEYVLFL